MQQTIEEVFLRFDIKDIRKSQFQEIMPDDLIAVEQTSPPVGGNHLDRIILVTYKNTQENSRFGFDARIEGITADYRIILRKLNDPSPCDLRIWPRIRLDLLPDVQAFYCDKEIQVIDISGGGTHIILPEHYGSASEPGMIINLKFVFAKGETEAEGKILRKWQDPCQRNHLAIQFHGNTDISQFIY